MWYQFINLLNVLDLIIIWTYSDMFYYNEHPTGTLKDSDKCDSIKESDFSVLMVVYEIIFVTFFKQISEINK